MSHTSLVQSKSSPLVITMLLMSFTLLGCGQKGPLKIEEPVVTQENTPSKPAEPAFSKHADRTYVNEDNKKSTEDTQQIFSQDY